MAKGLEDLEAATAKYREIDAARDNAHTEVMAKALALLRAGAEPGDVYARVPFTSTYMRTKARDAGVPAGRPGIKPPRGSQAAHDESPSPTNRA